MINRIQNIRKDSGFEVTDKINIRISDNAYSNGAIEAFEGDWLAAAADKISE